MRRRFFWRVALLFGLVCLLAVGFFGFLGWMAAVKFGYGPPDFGPPHFGPPRGSPAR